MCATIERQAGELSQSWAEAVHLLQETGHGEMHPEAWSKSPGLVGSLGQFPRGRRLPLFSPALGAPHRANGGSVAGSTAPPSLSPRSSHSSLAAAQPTPLAPQEPPPAPFTPPPSSSAPLSAGPALPAAPPASWSRNAVSVPSPAMEAPSCSIRTSGSSPATGSAATTHQTGGSAKRLTAPAMSAQKPMKLPAWAARRRTYAGIGGASANQGSCASMLRQRAAHSERAPLPRDEVPVVASLTASEDDEEVPDETVSPTLPARPLAVNSGFRIPADLHAAPTKCATSKAVAPESGSGEEIRWEGANRLLPPDRCAGRGCAQSSRTPSPRRQALPAGDSANGGLFMYRWDVLSTTSVTGSGTAAKRRQPLRPATSPMCVPSQGSSPGLALAQSTALPPPTPPFSCQNRFIGSDGGEVLVLGDSPSDRDFLSPGGPGTPLQSPCEDTAALASCDAPASPTTMSSLGGGVSGEQRPAHMPHARRPFFDLPQMPDSDEELSFGENEDEDSGPGCPQRPALRQGPSALVQGARSLRVPLPPVAAPQPVSVLPAPSPPPAAAALTQPKELPPPSPPPHLSNTSDEGAPTHRETLGMAERGDADRQGHVQDRLIDDDEEEDDDEDWCKNEEAEEANRSPGSSGACSGDVGNRDAEDTGAGDGQGSGANPDSNRGVRTGKASSVSAGSGSVGRAGPTSVGSGGAGRASPNSVGSGGVGRGSPGSASASSASSASVSLRGSDVPSDRATAGIHANAIDADAARARGRSSECASGSPSSEQSSEEEVSYESSSQASDG